MTEFDTFQPCLDALAYDLLLNPVIVDFTFTVPRKQRRRPFNQRDVTRALRAAKAAGIEARIEFETDGKLILVPVTTGDMLRSDDDDDIIARLA
jgi:hypothetical protein